MCTRGGKQSCAGILYWSNWHLVVNKDWGKSQGVLKVLQNEMGFGLGLTVVTFILKLYKGNSITYMHTELSPNESC